MSEKYTLSALMLLSAMGRASIL